MPKITKRRKPSHARALTSTRDSSLTRSLFKSVLFLVSAGLSVWSILGFYKPLLSYLDSFLSETGFQLQEVWVEGRSYTSLKTLQKTLSLKRGDSLFHCSPVHLKYSLERLPWVKSVRVQRYFPNTLFLQLKERKPLALWQKKGKKKLLDTEGKIILCDEKAYPFDLLTVVGEEAPQAAPSFFKLLSTFPQLMPRIQAAVYLRSGRWDLYLKDKCILKLPIMQEEAALKRFLEFEKKITPLVGIDIIDLRFQDRLIIQKQTSPKGMKQT